MGKASAAFTAYLAERRPLVEEWIAAHAWEPLPGNAPVSDLERYLYDPLARFTAGAGKRVRPVLALMGCEAVGGETERALAAGCAVELFQSAALIHDDIADGSTLRRGEPCLHVAEGLGLAVNAGDGALVQATQAILDDASLPAETRLVLLGELMDMERRTLEGQALDLGWSRDVRWDVTPENYLCMAERKTAAYSASSPLVLGAICGGGTEEQVEALRAFGLDAGLAFQIADDLLNLEGDPVAQGKDFRSDITEGKRTLIATWALRQLAPAEARELQDLLEAHTTDEDELAHAVELMESCGALEFAHAKAREATESALAHLDSVELVPDVREALVSMAHFFIERAS